MSTRPLFDAIVLRARFRRGGMLLGFLAAAAGLTAADEAPFPLTPPPLPKEFMQGGPGRPPVGLPDERQLLEQLRKLDELLSLPPEKLRQMRETIEMIERMSPEERESLRLRLLRFKQLPDELEKEINSMVILFSPDRHRLFREYWISLTEEERASARTELESLDRAGRIEWLTGGMTAFAERRDALFEAMRRQLEERRRKALEGNPEPKPVPVQP